jgi:hypothetical protein
MQRFEDTIRRGGAAALQEADRFFMKSGSVYETLRRISSKLAELKIPYAVAGGMAVSAHGHLRTTEDVDVLVTPEGLEKIHAELEGLGYVAPFAGSKNLRDTATSVRIEFLLTGQYPGDGKPKPVAFPDPAASATEIDGIAYLGLPALIELKLASGMTGTGRYKDLGDVLALIGELKIPLEFSTKLNPYVRDRFESLWHEAEQLGREID